MKTLKEFTEEINNSEELQKTLHAIKDKASLEGFLSQNGCEATADEFVQFVNPSNEGEISDDTAETAAGGWSAAWGSSKSSSAPQPRTLF